MVTYAIGDIQGCERSLARLLDTLHAAGGYVASRDRLWLVGDLVNRGPRSLGVLRRVAALARPEALGERLVCVLGNHDLHLLACAAGSARPRRGDTLDEILSAPDRDALIDWLRQRPLLHAEALGARRHVLVHAGLPRDWTVDGAAARARELERALAGPRWKEATAAIHRYRPDRWDERFVEDRRLAAVATALTRLRTARASGRSCGRFKGAPAEAPRGCLPWFDVPGRASAGATVVCGHWAALGLVLRPDLVALDTACVWGGRLTAVRLEDRAVFSVESADQASHA